MDIRQLRYFLAVAETLNFRRAAERLNISQPPLSMQIKQLEDELGVRLFERSRTGTFLTNSGRVLTDHARSILRAVELAERDTRLAGDSKIGKLRIGWTSSGDFTALLPNAIQSFRNTHHSVSIDLCEIDSYSQLDSITRGILDLGIARRPEKVVPAELAVSEIWRERLVVAVGPEWPFARQKSLSVDELRGCEIVTYLSGSGVGVNHTLRDLCRKQGFSPKIVQECGSTPMILGLVASGAGIGVIPAMMQKHGFDDIRFLPIDDPEASCAVCTIRRAADSNPILMDMIATINDVAQTLARRLP